MVAWLRFIINRWLKDELVNENDDWFAPTNEERTTLETSDDGLEKLVNNEDEIDDWVIHNQNAIISIPFQRQKKIIFLHNLSTDDDSVYGVRGFHTGAPVMVVDHGALSKGLVHRVKDVGMMGTIVPSFEDLMACESARDMVKLDIKEDKEKTRLTGKDFVDKPLVLSWSPFTIAVTENEAGNKGMHILTAEAALGGIMKKAKLALADKLVSETEAKQLWERHAQSLWLMAQGLKTKPAVEEPENADEIKFIDSTYKGLMKEFNDLEAKLNTVSKSRKEGTDAKKQARAGSEEDEEKKSDGEQSMRMTRSGRSKRAHKGSSERRSKRAKVTPNDGLAGSNDSVGGGRASDEEPPIQGQSSRRRSGKDKEKKEAMKIRTLFGPPARQGDGGYPSSSSSDEDSDGSGYKGNGRRRGDSGWDSDSDASESSVTKKVRELVQQSGNPTAELLMVQVLGQISDQQQRQARKDRNKHSAFKNWASTQIDLLRILSSDGFKEQKLPQLNRFVVRLCAQGKNINRAFNLLREKSENDNWPCRLSDASITFFMAKGLTNEAVDDSPQGISTFAFVPRDRIEVRSKKERKRQIQQVFGDGKLSDDTLSDLSDNHLQLPTDIYEAMDQIRSMIAFLRAITRPNGRCMATRGFEYVLTFLDTNKRCVKEAMELDGAFLIKFMYLADRCWQDYLRRLSRSVDDDDPLEVPHKMLRHHHTWFLDREFGALSTGGAVPALSLPRRLRSLQKELRHGGRGEIRDDSPGRGRKAQEKKAPKVDGEQDEEAVTNPSPRADWLLPQGYKYNDVFGGKDNKPNREGFPRFKHHANGRSTWMCIHYQVAGRCARGNKCMMAHLKPEDMPQGEATKIDTRLKEVYASLKPKEKI